MKDTDLQENLQKEIERVNKLSGECVLHGGTAGAAIAADMRNSIHKAVKARDKDEVTDKIIAVQELESYL